MIEITNQIALDYQKKLAEQRKKREIEKQKAKDEYKKTGKLDIDTSKIRSDLIQLSADAKAGREKARLAIQKNQISWKYRGLSSEEREKVMTDEEKKIMLV